MISFNLTFLLLFCIGKKYNCNFLQKKNKMWKPRGKKNACHDSDKSSSFLSQRVFRGCRNFRVLVRIPSRIMSKYFFSICQIPSFFTTAKVFPYNQIKPPIHLSSSKVFIGWPRFQMFFFVFMHCMHMGPLFVYNWFIIDLKCKINKLFTVML